MSSSPYLAKHDSIKTLMMNGSKSILKKRVIINDDESDFDHFENIKKSINALGIRSNLSRRSAEGAARNKLPPKPTSQTRVNHKKIREESALRVR